MGVYAARNSGVLPRGLVATRGCGYHTGWGASERCHPQGEVGCHGELWDAGGFFLTAPSPPPRGRADSQADNPPTRHPRISVHIEK